MAQRIVRGERTLAEARVLFEIPAHTSKKDGKESARSIVENRRLLDGGVLPICCI